MKKRKKGLNGEYLNYYCCIHINVLNINNIHENPIFILCNIYLSASSLNETTI